MTKQQITDDGDLRKYYIQIPNIVDEIKMSLAAFRLYVHLKRVAGDNGTCWQSTRTLADSCFMSSGMVSKVKKELTALKLITIKKEKNPKGGRDFHHIRILDKWGENFNKFATSSPDELASSSHEVSSSPDELKNNPLKKELKDSSPNFLLWEEFLKLWKDLFPKKTQPRKNNKKLKVKIKVRMQEQLFLDNWQEALMRASESATCQKKSWFHAEFFLRDSENYMKCYERWQEWQDEQITGVVEGERKGRNYTTERNTELERIDREKQLQGHHIKGADIDE